jgi:hypothetical protein
MFWKDLIMFSSLKMGFLKVYFASKIVTRTVIQSDFSAVYFPANIPFCYCTINMFLAGNTIFTISYNAFKKLTIFVAIFMNKSNFL